MEGELLVAYIILGFAGCAVLIAFVCWRIFERAVAPRRVVGIPAPPTPPWTPALRWLVLLAAATTVLLIIQLVLGYLTHALVLVADAAHGAADCASYFLAAFLEFLKHTFGTKAVSPLAIDRLDRVSAAFSVIVVLTNSIVVAVEACRQLRDAPKHKENHLGAAMVAIACLGLVLNVTLLIMHFRIQQVSKIPSQNFGDRSPKSPSSRTRKNRQRKETEGFSLHAAFHPGCQGQGMCAGSKPNLNVYGVVLHVGTDVLRTLLMLVVGILVELRLLGNHLAKIDAICAFAICGCVVLGSSYLVYGAIRGKNGDDKSPATSAYGAMA